MNKSDNFKKICTNAQHAIAGIKTTRYGVTFLARIPYDTISNSDLSKKIVSLRKK